MFVTQFKVKSSILKFTKSLRFQSTRFQFNVSLTKQMTMKFDKVNSRLGISLTLRRSEIKVKIPKINRTNSECSGEDIYEDLTSYLIPLLDSFRGYDQS